MCFLRNCKRCKEGKNGVSATLSLVLPAETDNSVNRFIVEIYNNRCENLVRRIEKTVVAGSKSCEISLSLSAGHTYNFLVWADCGKGGEDLFYDSSKGLKQLSIKGDYSGNEPGRMAFCANETFRITRSLTRTVSLYSPFARLSFYSSDNQFDDKQIPQEIQVRFHAKKSFDVLVEECTGNLTEMTYSITPSQEALREGNSLGEDLIFAPFDRYFNTQIILDIKDASGKTIHREFSNIPLRRGWKTEVRGSLFSQEGVSWMKITPETVV